MSSDEQVVTTTDADPVDGMEPVEQSEAPEPPAAARPKGATAALTRPALEARRARAIRDLVETQQQLEAGEIDEDTAARLTAIYEREVVEALEALDGYLEDPPPASTSNRRMLTISIGMIAACVVIAAFATGALRPRASGQAVTGSTPGGATTTTTVRDLSTVSNEEMEQVLAQNPGVTAMRLALAERYLASTPPDLTKAMNHITIALGQNPDDTDKARALRDLGWTTHLQGNSAEGAKDLQQSLQLVPDDPNTQFWLAEVDIDGLHNPKAAIPLLQKLLQTQQNDPQALTTVQQRLDQAQAAAG